MKAYRIVKRKYSRSAFSGEGARLFGGRWNSPGVALVYTASSISLAVLEWRAHLGQWPPPPVVIIEIEFAEDLVWSPVRLPPNWRRTPALASAAAVGDNWARARRSAVLKLPSAIVPAEFNFLLNPGHPDFSRIKIGKPRIFQIDLRLDPMEVG